MGCGCHPVNASGPSVARPFEREFADPITLPPATTVLLTTNLKGNLHHILGNQYGLHTWIEYGFKYLKNKLGWADYCLTTYSATER